MRLNHAKELDARNAHYSLQRRKELIAALKVCSSTGNLEEGKIIHKAAIETGDASNVYVGNTLIDMYRKCGSMQDARRVFDSLNLPDVVCWTALILGYADTGESHISLDLFWRMRRESCAPDARTFVAALKACSDLTMNDASGKRGEKLHLLVLLSGVDSDIYVGSTLVDMYAKCHRLEVARTIFDSMKHLNVVSWNVLISGYVENGKGDIALELFSQMEQQGCTPDARSFVAVLKIFTALSAIEAEDGKVVSRKKGKALHLLACRIGCDLNIYLKNTFVDMYSNCGSLIDARKVFDSIQHPNVVSWNALVMGYAENGKAEIALDLFASMGLASWGGDKRTFIAALKACIGLKLRSKKIGKEIHLLILRSGFDGDIYVASTLIDMFAKVGSMEDARRAFDSLRRPNVVCWTALLFGYADNGEGETCLNLFLEYEDGFPNERTFLAVLRSCSLMGALDIGKRIHLEIRSCGLEHDEVLGNALVDLYVKCGNLIEAKQLFDSHASRNLITWNTMMAGYSHHGNTQGVFDLFDRMLDAGLKPDAVTFSCILTVCNYVGLVDKGIYYFQTMSTMFGINPDIEHYTCMADILSRANKLDDAMVLLRNMPFNPEAVTWMTIIGGCRKWKNVDVGKLAFESLTSLDDTETGAYVLMANICG